MYSNFSAYQLILVPKSEKPSSANIAPPQKKIKKNKWPILFRNARLKKNIRFQQNEVARAQADLAVVYCQTSFPKNTRVF